MNDGTDPIDIVRAARHHISERLGHDPVKVVEHYMTLQQTYRGRLLEERTETAEHPRQGDKKDGSPRQR